ncbi:preprotein translocase subunit SecA [bacterium]|nr:preprotein translocase subunit SecA [bacterium]
MGILNKIFGDANEKYLRSIYPYVEKINSLEKNFERLSQEELRKKTLEFKERIKKGQSLDNVLPEAFAVVREAAKRTLGQRHFDCQLIGGIVLHQGKIAEMKTGEGKTLAATLPLYLNALTGRGVHLVTVNDYLARRDTVWMGQIYHYLGLSVGCLNHEQSFIYDPEYKKPDEEKDKIRDELGSFKVVEDFLRPCTRKEAYQADITYGTNNEFGFDYLRDNMVYSSEEEVQRGFFYAIIDEIDSILIDEARTPLIISSPAEKSTEKYYRFARLISQFKENQDYVMDAKMRIPTFTEKGQERIIRELGFDPWAKSDIITIHQLEAALKARVLFKRDRDYIVKNGEVIIVDEFTGRLMPGRRWSGGLHQAVEAKEGLEVKPESRTLASITFQNYFRMYEKLAGMTGTAATSAEEFDKVYNLEVISVPTNKPMIRKDLPDRVYRTKKGKLKAIVEEVKKRHALGQPILIGTGVFAAREHTEGAIEKNRIIKRLLEREGIACQVLDATNHEREGEIIAQAGRLGQVTVATNMAGRGVDIILGGNPPDPEEAKKVRALGGLHVIGTERHEARRIDNQLRGRAGRQGDPGSSQFFVSLEDDLMQIFGGEKLKVLMEKLNIPEDQPIEAKMVSNAIEAAQSKLEGMNFDARKHLLEYDDVLNKHRETFYRKRKEILRATPDDLRQKVIEMIERHGYSKDEYQKKEELIGKENMLKIMRFVALRTMDMLWIDHLYMMEHHLKDSVRLRAYGAQDPLVEYKTEGHRLFRQFLDTIEKAIVHSILNIEINKKESPQPPQYFRRTVVNHRQVRQTPGRNDPCPCGSGKKYKKCCWPKYG